MPDRTPIRPTRSYIILATPRSGSNWFCELLSSVGTLGRPEEYFWAEWRTRWGPLPFGDFLESVLREGTGGNGVFGLKLMWYQLEALAPELEAYLDLHGVDAGRLLERAFAHPRYLLLTRRDRLRQAISLERAIQSGQWRSGDPRSENSNPTYSREAIDAHLAFLGQEEERYREFCGRLGVPLPELLYEDIVAAPDAAIQVVQGTAGIETAEIDLPSMTRHQRQSDPTTDEWARRYQQGH